SPLVVERSLHLEALRHERTEPNVRLSSAFTFWSDLILRASCLLLLLFVRPRLLQRQRNALILFSQAKEMRHECGSLCGLLQRWPTREPLSVSLLASLGLAPFLLMFASNSSVLAPCWVPSRSLGMKCSSGRRYHQPQPRPWRLWLCRPLL